MQESIYSLCPPHVSGLPQSLQTFLYNWLTSSFKSLQHALKTNLVTLQMETANSSEMLKFIHNSTQYHNPKAIMYTTGNLLFGSDFEKKQHCRRWTLKRSEVAWDSLKNISLMMTVQEHMQFFFIRKEMLFFTFTMTSHANSVQMLYMRRHSMTYHAYFTFCKDKLEFMLKIEVILTYMKDLNAEM